ncbi:MAG TPA: outer membrane protein assembly factor BamA, partial [Candidatus Deferrimicrobium sp.]|nr:outer membrane protein assembly factor BamA [Candidatus Deferrimicrobium sp.]
LKVVEIVVEGNRVAGNSLILGASSIQEGAALTPAAVSETIRRLYGLGMFSDVAIDAETVGGGLKVFLVVRELPKLTGLEFNGNKKIKTKELKEDLGLGVGGYISPYLMRQKASEIHDKYARKGYFQAEITPTLQYNTDSTEAVLTFRIAEKSRVKVEQVVLTGCSRVKPESLVKKMRNRKRGFLKSSDFAEDKYDEDLGKIIEEYHRKGFVDAYVMSDSIHIDTARNRMTIFLDVYEGPKYYFGDVRFQSNQQLKTASLQAMLKFRAGEVFDADKYSSSLEELYAAYSEIGYLHVRIVDEKSTRADSLIDVTYDLTEGLPSHVRMVNIVGNRKTKDKVIRREIAILPGTVFSRSLLIRSVREVMALNFFENVEPDLVPLPSGDADIEFKVKEKQTGQVSAGAGYNSQDKLVGTLGMAIPNFRGNGQNLTFSVDFGSRRNSFSVSFTEPWLAGRPTLLGVNVFALNRRWFDDYTEGRQGGSVRLGRRLHWPDNYFRVYGSYELERTRFFDFDDLFVQSNSFRTLFWYDRNDGSSRQDRLLGSRTHSAAPGSILRYNEDWLAGSRASLSVVRDSRNLPEFATSGARLAYTLDYTGGLLGGFWNYQKHSLSLAKFIPIVWHIALAAKVEYAVVTSPGGDDRILITDRFTPGGTAYDGVVRGYDDGSLTPDSVVTRDTSFYYADSNAFVGVDPPDDTTVASFKTRVHGKYMLTTNLELQFPIASQQIYGLLFFDAGNSWLHRRDIKPLTGLYKGLGFGFRIAVPGIGTLGFDFGYPLDDVRGQKRSLKPHFQVGTTFR